MKRILVLGAIAAGLTMSAAGVAGAEPYLPPYPTADCPAGQLPYPLSCQKIDDRTLRVCSKGYCDLWFYDKLNNYLCHRKDVNSAGYYGPTADSIRCDALVAAVNVLPPLPVGDWVNP